MLTTLGTTLVFLSATLAIALNQSRVRSWVSRQLWVPPREMAAPPFDLRDVLLNSRDRALAGGDVRSAAMLNAKLAQEALLRARAVHAAWLARRHPQTKLYAQRYSGGVWNYRNTAADFFGFHLHAALRLSPESLPSLRQTLAAELTHRTAQGLCQPVMADTAEPVAVAHAELMFASSEYCKDGLISVYERHGGEIVGARMLAIVDAIISESRESSAQGPLPGEGSEINGNLLQLGARLTCASGEPRYAEYAARIADALVRQAMPANGGIPPKFFDYDGNRLVDATLKLKDHGNEVLPGLAEIYAFAVMNRADPNWSRRASEWSEPLATMFEIVLRHGVNSEGLFVATMAPDPPRPTSTELCDNWGYILLGATLFVQASQRHGALAASRVDQLDRRVNELIEAVLDRTPPRLFDGGADSEADALESMLYMAHFRPHFRDRALAWVDRQIELMFAHQRPDGLAGMHYLDGNFIRTSLMYADARSGGFRVEPFREDVLVGFARDPRAPRRAVLFVQCTEPYTGVLRADSARHAELMKLPWDWPRLNCWPEWFVPSSGARVSGSEGLTPPPTIRDVQRGLPINLPRNGEVTLTFELAE